MTTNRLVFFIICMLLLSSCSQTGFLSQDENMTQITKNRPEITNPADIPTEIGPDLTIALETDNQVDFGRSARAYLEVLSEKIGDRPAGSEEEKRAADYIQGVFDEMGYSSEKQTFDAYDEYEGLWIESSNIIAVKKGESEQQIIVGAHYDSVDDGGSQGADDNASGVAVMLEVAEEIIEEQTPYTIVFVAFGAEEIGLFGSDFYMDHLSDQDQKRIIGMFNLDSLIAGDKVYVYGNEGPGSMRDWVLEDADEAGLEIEGKTDEDMLYEDGSLCECSDYDAFEKENIPYAYFEATNWDLSPDGMIQVDPRYGGRGEIRHSEFDTIEYIEETFPGRIDHHLNVFVTLLYDLVTQY